MTSRAVAKRTRTPTISPSCATPISFGPRPPGGSPFGGGRPPTATPGPSTSSDALPTSRTSSMRAWRQPTVTPASPPTTRPSSMTTRGPVRPAGPSAPSCPAWETKTRTTTTSTNGAHDSSAWPSCMASEGQEEEEEQGRTGWQVGHEAPFQPLPCQLQLEPKAGGGPRCFPWTPAEILLAAAGGESEGPRFLQPAPRQPHPGATAAARSKERGRLVRKTSACQGTEEPEGRTCKWVTPPRCPATASPR